MFGTKPFFEKLASLAWSPSRNPPTSILGPPVDAGINVPSLSQRCRSIENLRFADHRAIGGNSGHFSGGALSFTNWF